ncbi:MAG TPA: O-antigen ligase family protein [Anaeromyxobacteraceae bacterium]
MTELPRGAGGRLALAGLLLHSAFLPLSIAGMQIGLGVALLGLLLRRLEGAPAWARSPLDLPALALAGAAAASVGLAALAGLSPVGWHEATLWRSVLAPLVVLSAAEAAGEGDPAATRRWGLAALTTWAAAAAIPGLLAWPQHYTGFDLLQAIGIRARHVSAPAPFLPGRFAAVGLFTWYQRLAHNLTPPLLVAGAVALLAPLPRARRVVLGGAALLSAMAVVLTTSRAAWLGLALGGALVLLAGGPRARRVLPLLAAAGLALAAATPSVRARVATIGLPDFTGDRQKIWSVCAAVIGDHPLTGVGFGAFPKRSLPYWERMAPDWILRTWCHDAFLSAWAEGGPLLAAALVAWLALLARAALRWRRGGGTGGAAGAGAVGAVAAFAVAALFHDVLHASEGMYGLGFALGVAAALARAERPAEDDRAPPASAG